MAKPKFSIAHKDEEMLALVSKTDQKTLALWAIDCAERVMPYFEEKYPQDNRPRQALNTLQTWLDTGVFKMAVIRKASLDAHAAARDVGEDSPARSAARAAGQAVATAHVAHHAYGPAIYAQQAIHRASTPAEADAAAAQERDWQYQQLLARQGMDENSEGASSEGASSEGASSEGASSEGASSEGASSERASRNLKPETQNFELETRNLFS